MSADTSDLTKVDSAIAGVDTTAAKDGAKESLSKRRTTSSAPGVMNISELGKIVGFCSVPRADGRARERRNQDHRRT